MNKKGKVKKTVLISVIAFLFIGTILTFTVLKKDNKIEPKVKEIEFVAKKGNLQKVIETTGEVIPNLEVEIKCKASGEISELPVDVSDIVKNGDLLLQLDPEDEETSVKQAEVSLLVSKSEFEQAELNLAIAKRKVNIEELRTASSLKLAKVKREEFKSKFARAKVLNKKNLTTDENLEAAQTSFVEAFESVINAKADIDDLESLRLDIKLKEQNVIIAKAKVESNRLSLKDAQKRLKDVTVLAPIDGVISNQNVQIGQIIASGINNVDGGTTIMTIADLSKMFVLASVDESSIGDIKEDQNATICVDAYPDLIFPGKVVRIATTGKTVSSVVTFEVKIEVEGKNRSLLKPGMTADIKILALEKKNIITLPLAAVTRKLKKQYVTILNKTGNKVGQLVKVGVNDGKKIEIISGVKIGDVVVVVKNPVSKWSNNNNNNRKMKSLGRSPIGRMKI